ncbi:TolC family protein [bacterium]|nr:TolC family protein [bacterium]
MKRYIFFGLTILATAVRAQELSSESSYAVQISDTLTLRECIRIALENQPAIGTSQGAVITAESDYTQVQSLLFPQIQLEAGAYVTNTPLQSSNVIASSPIYDPKQGTKFIPNIRMTIKQPIYDFGRTAKSLESKDQLIKAAELSLASTEEDVVLNVHITYYNYIQAQQVVKINEERVAQSRKHVERAKGFFEVGKLPESEVSKAELEVASAELELINAKGQLRLAKVNLNSAMGITEVSDEPSNYVTPLEVEYAPFTNNLKECIDAALQSRKEVTAGEMRIKASKAALSAARSQYGPIITASGGLGPYIIQKDPADKLSKDKFKLGYNVGLNFAFPIFQGLSVRADIAEAQGGIRIATSQYNVLKQKIIQEVQERYFSVKYAEERYKASEKIVVQGEKNLLLAEGRFDTGIGSAIEVTDANLSLANARIDRTTALYQYQVELSKFKRTIGKIKETH